LFSKQCIELLIIQKLIWFHNYVILIQQYLSPFSKANIQERPQLKESIYEENSKSHKLMATQTNKNII